MNDNPKSCRVCEQPVESGTGEHYMGMLVHTENCKPLAKANPSRYQ